MRRLEALPAALRAPVPVGPIRCGSVMCLDDGFGLLRHLVNRAVAEVDQLLAVNGKTPVPKPPRVACVGCRDRVAACQRFRHEEVKDETGRAAVADADELAVPGLGQPHFEMNLGPRYGSYRSGDPAEWRQACVRRWRTWRSGRGECSGRRHKGADGDIVSRRDGCVRQAQLREVATGAAAGE
jgi:hypothetical protein